MSADERSLLRAIVRVVAEGERMRGTGGVIVYADASNVRYMLVRELGTEELRERVEDMLSDEGDEYVFALKDENKATHIWKLPRVKIAEMLSEIDHAVTPSAHGLQT